MADDFVSDAGGDGFVIVRPPFAADIALMQALANLLEELILIWIPEAVT